MITYHTVRRRGNLPSGWDHHTIPATSGALFVFGRCGQAVVTFGLMLDATLTWKQRQDAIAHFQKAARIEAMRQPRKLNELIAYRRAS